MRGPGFRFITRCEVDAWFRQWGTPEMSGGRADIHTVGRPPLCRRADGVAHGLGHPPKLPEVPPAPFSL